jgi:hypothetical protein
MYIFGGIFELTKELNDMVIFDFATRKFTTTDSTYEPISPDKSRLAAENQSAYGGDSPSKTNKGSPLKRRTMLGGASPYSPPKKNRMISPSKTMAEAVETTASKDEKKKEKDGLSSPTSISMRNSFIIKNADQSFEVYYKKRKAAGGFNNTYGHDATQHTH